MDLLVFLARAQGRVVSKDEIIEAVWEGRFIADATLTRSIADLRRALGDGRRRRQYIETIAKRGYRLVAAVGDIEHLVGSANVLGVATERGPASPNTPSLVVLPFANLGPESDGYFCGGLTEEIITALTRLPGLRVISRTSAFAAHARGGDIADIGRRLDVTHAIEGSVRRAEGRIRVSAQLIEVSSHAHLWSERYDRPLSDIFLIQDEIAAAIARRLELTFSRPGEREEAPTSNIEAYSLFLEGRHHFLRATRESLEHARRCFTEAIELDPDFAAAYDARAELHWYLGFYGLTATKEAFTLALWDSLRALEIDDRLAETHALLAMLRKALDYNWSEVEREYGRAFELNPRSPVVRLRHAICGLQARGHVNDAAAELAAVVETDPLSIFVRWWLAIMYWLSRQPARMREQVERMLEIDPAHPSTQMALGTCQATEGDSSAAVASYEKAAELGGRHPWLLGWLGLAYGAARLSDQARKLREELLALSESTYVPPFSIGVISLGLGEVDDAFRWMDRAIDVRDPLISPILSYPYLDALRVDPRYQRLLARMNLGKNRDSGAAVEATRAAGHLPPSGIDGGGSSRSGEEERWGPSPAKL